MAFSFAVQTDGFSLIASFGTGLNSILTINITVFHSWVVRAKGTKSTLTGTVVTSRTFRAKVTLAGLASSFVTLVSGK